MIEPLLGAIKANDLGLVKSLLIASKDLASAKDERGVSVVLLAKYYHREEAAQLLVELRGETLDIFEAAAVGDLITVLQLLRKTPILCREFSADGYTALHLAAFFGHPSVVETLLEEGADVHEVSTNSMKLTPLQSAAAHDDPTLATGISRILLDKGADVNARQAGGYTALHTAAGNGNFHLAKLLLTRGADRLAKSDQGELPRDYARKSNHLQMDALL